ncbi:WXG100 family type VII secretion target [Nocardia asteroides]|uniref:WXG100 family type VII secretion target n=1 Tax=Nocardia asteroides TaxID=1824 RepID=UPI00341E8E19
MVDNTQPFRVDLAELEQIVARVSGFIGFLEDSLDGLHSRIAQIQQSWSGQSADAQAEVFREWNLGASDVSEGIQLIRNAAQDARDRYTSATQSTLAILGRG